MDPDTHTAAPRMSPGRIARLFILFIALFFFAALPAFAEVLGLRPAGMGDALNKADGLGVVKHIAYVAVIMSVRYGFVGLFAGLMVGVAIRRGLLALPVGIAVWVVAVSLGALLHRTDGLALPRTDTLMLALTCAAVGHLIGWGFMLRSWRRWAAVGVMFIALIVAAVWAVGVGGKVIESSAAAVDMPPITREDKKRIVEIAQRPIHEDQHGIAEITFDPADLQRMGAWACDISPGNQAIDIELTPGGTIINGRLDLPGKARYVNLTSAQQVIVDDGSIDLTWQSLTLGQWEAPGALLYLATPVLRSLVIDEPGNRAIIGAVDEFALSPDGVTIRYDADRMANVLRSQLTGGAQIAAFDQARQHIDHLLGRAGTWPKSRGRRFEAIVSDAFAFAKQRSDAGADPVRENRAAIYALATTMGSPDLTRFTGPTIDRSKWDNVQELIKRPRMYGRIDWTKHFMLSAGITLLTDEGFSDAVGMLKEDIDIGAGGTGYSFPDLAADRAGTRFAQVATRDAASARRIQSLLADPQFHVSLLLPNIADLPEGLREAQLNEQFDGIDGPRFREMAAEIERRLDTCPALK